MARSMINKNTVNATYPHLVAVSLLHLSMPQMNNGRSATNNCRDDAFHIVEIRKIGERENENATINAKKSSFFISLAIRYDVSAPSTPINIEIISMTDSILIPVHCDTPDSMNRKPLEYDMGVSPKNELGLITHFAQPYFDIVFARTCWSGVSQPYS